jgi:hypothetical protein
MKKVKLSLVVALAILGASVTAFTGKTTITPGWYGQTSEQETPELTYPIDPSQLDSKCPSSTQKICAVQLDMNEQVTNTRKSTHNFLP